MNRDQAESKSEAFGRHVRHVCSGLQHLRIIGTENMAMKSRTFDNYSKKGGYEWFSSVDKKVKRRGIKGIGHKLF